MYFFSNRARLRARVNKITFAQKNLNMIRARYFGLSVLWQGSGKGSGSTYRHSPVSPNNYPYIQMTS